MRRRTLLAVLGIGAAGTPVLARAQQPVNSPRIGIIDDAPLWDPFRSELHRLGNVPGRNIAFQYSSTADNPDRLAAAARSLVEARVDLIATFGTPASRAAKQATSSTPIVAISVGDPVGAGLVASLARPGGNVTGNTILGPDLVSKRLQLLREMIPTVRRVAFLWNPDNASNATILEQLKATAPALGIELLTLAARTAADFDRILPDMAGQQADAFLMTNDPFHQSHAGRIIGFLAQHRIPGMFQTRENAVAGGLVSYSASFSELFRNGAVYAHKILQGKKPADLPVEQPTKFELVINNKTARALGLTIPPSILARADEVIE